MRDILLYFKIYCRVVAINAYKYTHIQINKYTNAHIFTYTGVHTKIYTKKLINLGKSVKYAKKILRKNKMQG